MADIVIDAVRKDFGAITALAQLDLHVADGEFLALLGPSGCGKTTLLRIIAGLETQSAGRVLIGGRDVSIPAAPQARVGDGVPELRGVSAHDGARQCRLRPAHDRRRGGRGSSARSTAPQRCCISNRTWIDIRRSSLAGSGSALRWLARWRWNPRCC